jgi:hypothetical protein
MADYRDIVALPEHRAAVIGELIRVYLEARFANPLPIGWIDPASDTPALVADACRAMRVPFTAWQQPCHRWFPEAGENLNRKFSRIRTHLNHFKRLGRVTFDVIERQDDWSAFRDAFFQQHSLRQLQADRPISFDDPRKRRFYDRIFDSEIRMHATAVRLDGEMLAGHVGFVWRDVLMLGAPSISLEHEPRSPALVLLSWIIQNAAPLGLRGFDLTIGDTEFKRRLGNQIVPVTGMEVYGSKLAYIAQSARRGIIRVAKSSLGSTLGDRAWDDRVKPAIGAITARARLAKDQGFQAVLGKTRAASPESAVLELTAADLAQPETPGHLRANRVEDLLLWTGEDAETTRAVRACARVYARQRGAGATLQTLVDDGRLLAWCFVHPPSDGCARITCLAATPELRRGDGMQRFAARVARTAVAGGASRVVLAQD